MRRALPLAVALVLARAAAAADGAPEPFTESIVELRVNAQPGTVTLIVRRDSDGVLLLREADLATLRLRTPSRGLVTVEGERYYRIGSEIGARVVFDPVAQTVELDLPAQAFVATQFRPTAPDAPPPIATGAGGFLNYDLSVQQTGTDTNGGGFLELGMFSALGVLTGSVVARYEQTGAEAVRLDTTWTRDFPESLHTLRVGDAVSSPGAWGRAVRFGGLQFGTNFSTQPALVTTPLLSTSGEAIVPSTVDVFVNGRQVASEDVPPGPFDIGQLPAISGAGQMQVVVTDALGRQQVLTQPYYSGTTLLRRGLNEYSVEFGSARLNYTRRSNDYGEFVGAATFRRGLTDRLTAEVHAEGEAGGTGAAGLAAAWQVGTLGILSATAAAGGDQDGYGWLGGLGIERSGPRLGVYARTLWSSETFAQLGTAGREERPRQQSSAGASLNLFRRGSLQALYGMQSFWNAPTLATAGLGYSLGLGTLGYVSLFVSRTDSDRATTDVLLSWTVSLGQRRSANSTLRYGPTGLGDTPRFEAAATLQQNLPVDSGAGYAVSVSSNEDYRLGAAYQGRAGVVTADYAQQSGESGWRAGAYGGLAITGAGVMPSRRLDQSFAVVQVADYEGIDVMVENQVVARTDDKGRVLLENLRPYEANQVSIDPTALPMDATLGAAKIAVTPAYRSGAMVRFPVTRADAVTLRLEQADGTPVPAGAAVTVGGATFRVAMNGLVYLTGLAGRSSAVATWRDGTCMFDVERPSGSEPLPDLGTVECRRRAADGERR